MEIIIQKDELAGSKVAANIFESLIRKKPNAVLGLATGSTPLKLYAELIRKHKDEALDFSLVQTFNLDEYVGLAPEHYASYDYFMRENFFSGVNVADDNIHIPDGLTDNIPDFCEQYEFAMKKAGGLDLQVLGIGTDGHLGFNEPTSSLASRTRIKTLLEQTREDNKRFFKEGEAVPYHVITMGIGTIMEAKTCVLLAFGEGKADAIKEMVEGPLCAMVPGSALQMHPDTKIIVDEAAASKLSKLDYYKWVYQNKPEWQQY